MNNVDLSTNVLSLCAGYGGIDLGLRLALPSARTVCYVEREATVAAILAARFEDGSLDDAPVWSDLRTFDGKPWRNSVDLIAAGYPCQPFSVAGKQAGKDDPRHLWPEVARIIREVSPEWVFLENVANHLKLGFREVHAQLRRMGYSVACGLFSAEEVGAPHIRLRLFALAHRDGAGREARDELAGADRASRGESRGVGAALAHGESGGRGVVRESPGRVGLAYGHGEELEDAARLEQSRQEREGSGWRRGVREAGDVMADAEGDNWRRRIVGAQTRVGTDGIGRRGFASDGAALALAPVARLPQRSDGRHRQQERSAALRSRVPVFPPGPSDLDAWRQLLADWPQVEPAFCGAPDGTSNRVDQLRALGNGVVPLVVALAYRTLRDAFTD